MICDNCGKPDRFCVCSLVEQLECKTHVLILQHPQENREKFGTGKFLHLCLPNSTFKVGLSWRNFEAAIGSKVDRTRWAILYLGSTPGNPASTGTKASVISLVNPNTKRLESAESLLTRIQGIVVLDGTWSQAKTLWWRNPWLLKLPRIALFPRSRSMYGKIRKQPKKEGLSTFEAVALFLSEVEGEEVGKRLSQPLRKFVERHSKK